MFVHPTWSTGVVNLRYMSCSAPMDLLILNWATLTCRRLAQPGVNIISFLPSWKWKCALLHGTRFSAVRSNSNSLRIRSKRLCSGTCENDLQRKRFFLFWVTNAPHLNHRMQFEVGYAKQQGGLTSSKTVSKLEISTCSHLSFKKKRFNKKR